MKKDPVREFLSKAGKRGGRARARKYDRATLVRWAKKGGRPPKRAAERKP